MVRFFSLTGLLLAVRPDTCTQVTTNVWTLGQQYFHVQELGPAARRRRRRQLGSARDHGGPVKDSRPRLVPGPGSAHWGPVSVEAAGGPPRRRWCRRDSRPAARGTVPTRAAHGEQTDRAAQGSSFGPGQSGAERLLSSPRTPGTAVSSPPRGGPQPGAGRAQPPTERRGKARAAEDFGRAGSPFPSPRTQRAPPLHRWVQKRRPCGRQKASGRASGDEQRREGRAVRVYQMAHVAPGSMAVSQA